MLTVSELKEMEDPCSDKSRVRNRKGALAGLVLQSERFRRHRGVIS
jgi:hypothetical protein